MQTIFTKRENNPWHSHIANAIIRLRSSHIANKKGGKYMIDLKETRLKNKKTQQEMANLLGIGLTTYHQYESSDRDVPYKIAKKIAAIFGVNVEDIFLPTRFTISKRKKDN